MGWSCRADASRALDRIEAAAQVSAFGHVCKSFYGKCTVPNGNGHGTMSSLVVNDAGAVLGFYEVNTMKEHADGAITGTVTRVLGTFPWASDAQSRLIPPAKRAGSFKISPDGDVVRFPLMGKKILAAARRS